MEAQKDICWKQKGFTLVELLVVIGILGIIATVILTIINPPEQTARGRDVGSSSFDFW